MNKNDALKIMNLDINYTEDDLKREYRKLVTKYHPVNIPTQKKAFMKRKLNY